MTVHRWWKRAAAALVAVVGLVAVAHIPVPTRQGVDFVVSTTTMPLYLKTLEFVQRDASYGALAERIAGDAAAPDARALAVFEWTTAHIRDTPAGFPIVDDHVWHIIVRGYGEDDQKADVFTTLATYAGVPSFFVQDEPPLSFAWIDRQWRVFDVANHIVFRTARGGLASADDLVRDRALVARAGAGRQYRGRAYQEYFDDFAAPPPPDLLRAELQMVWPRAVHRLKRLVGLGRREWQG